MSFSRPVGLVAALAVPALHASAQQLDAEQVPAVYTEGSIQIEQSPEGAGDTLRVDQPSQAATDICDTAGVSIANSGNDCDSIALPVAPGVEAASGPVKVTEDGVFVRIEPQEDDVYDPDEITRRLGSDQALDPQDFGAGGIVTQTLDPLIVSEPLSDAPPALIDNADPFQLDLPIE